MKRFFIMCKETGYDECINTKIYDTLTNEEYINLDVGFKNTEGKTTLIFTHKGMNNIIDLGGEELLKRVVKSCSQYLLLS